MRKTLFGVALLGLGSCSSLWMSFANDDPDSCYGRADDPGACAAGKICDKTTYLCVDANADMSVELPQDMGDMLGEVPDLIPTGNEDGGVVNCIDVQDPPPIPADKHVRIEIASGLTGMAVGDFMAKCGDEQVTDGRADVAVYASNSRRMLFFYGDPQSGLVDPMLRYDLPGTRNPSFLAYAKSNKPVVASGFTGGTEIRLVSYNPAMRAFESSALTASGTTNLLAAGNVTGGAEDDLILTSTNTGSDLNADKSVNVLPGTGNGTFGTRIQLKPPGDPLLLYASAINLSGNAGGQADIVGPLTDLRKVNIWSTASSMPRQVLNLSTSNSVFAIGADVDGDQKTDIVVGHIDYFYFVQSRLSVFTRKADGGFNNVVECTMPFNGPFMMVGVNTSSNQQAIAIAANARRDILVLKLTIADGKCTVSNYVSPIDTTYTARSVAYEDVNGDGKRDLVYLSSSGSRARLGALIQ